MQQSQQDEADMFYEVGGGGQEEVDEVDGVRHYGLTMHADVPYAMPVHYKQCLDIYLPPAPLLQQGSPKSGNKSLLPVVIHVHGGGWKRGDRKHWFYGAPFMAQGYAKRGFVSVAVSYSLNCEHPASVNDVASAVKWVRDNIESFQGDPDRIFLSGHSAGGHIVSLLVTDPSYLTSRGVNPGIIKGVVCVSGIYTLANPMGEDGSCSWRNGVFKAMYSNTTFGKTDDVLNRASPSIHVRTQRHYPLPPMMLLNAASDFGLERDTIRMHRALTEAGHWCSMATIPGTNHGSVTRDKRTVDLAKEFISGLLVPQQ